MGIRAMLPSFQLMDLCGQTPLIIVGLFVYAVHMISIPIWFQRGIAELQRQRRMMHNDSKARPMQWEYWVVRLFLGYVLADAIRGLDGMCDNQIDGTVRSVWGITRMDVRFFFWWLRDAFLFLTMACVLEFNIKWASIML